ncbi:MAG: hypothetical protein ABIF17_03125 [Patescibacteria group bacterium]
MPKNKTQIDIDILKRFSKQARKLDDKKYDELGRIKIDITINKNVGQVKKIFPKDEIVESFLINIRMFVMKDSNFNFKKISNYFIENNFEIEKIKLWMQTFDDIFKSEAVSLKVGNKPLTTNFIYNTILNEDNFHQEKNQKGMTIINSHPVIESLSRSKFNKLICQLRMIVCNFNKQIVEEYLKRYEQ